MNLIDAFNRSGTSGRRLASVFVFLLLQIAFAPQSIAAPRYPTIFVHGIGSEGTIWEPMVQYMHANGVRFGGHVHYQDNDSAKPLVVEQDARSIGDLSNAVYYVTFSDQARRQSDPIVAEAAELSAMITRVRSASFSNSAKVNLVGHSMGGLVSRAYVQNAGVYNARQDVDSLITIGSPHLGTSLSVVAGLGLFLPDLTEQEIAVNQTVSPTLQDLNTPRGQFSALH